MDSSKNGRLIFFPFKKFSRIRVKILSVLIAKSIYCIGEYHNNQRFSSVLHLSFPVFQKPHKLFDYSGSKIRLYFLSYIKKEKSMYAEGVISTKNHSTCSPSPSLSCLPAHETHKYLVPRITHARGPRARCHNNNNSHR